MTYLSETIYRRIKRLRVAGDTEPFCTWINLQAWCLENYSPPDPTLEAELAMNCLHIKASETVQDFTNRFETVLADLTWNESTVCSQYQKKLNAEVASTVHQLQSTAGYPMTFTTFKQAAQKAENHVHIRKRSAEDHGEPLRKINFSEPHKRLQFNLLAQEGQNSPSNYKGGHQQTFTE